MTGQHWIADARETDPQGGTCTYCGKPNDFADDCGWFYLWPGHGLPDGTACEACYDGPPGGFHISIYGVGER